MPGAVIGERCSLGQNVVVMNGTRDREQIEDPEQRVDLRGRGARGRRVLRAVDGVHERHESAQHVSRKNEYRRTLVNRGASIGANATIVCGVDARRVRVHRRRRGDDEGRAAVRADGRRAGATRRLDVRCGERLSDGRGGRPARRAARAYEQRGDGIGLVDGQ